MLLVNGCLGVVFQVRNLRKCPMAHRTDEYGGRQEAQTSPSPVAACFVLSPWTTTLKIFQSCTLRRPLTTRCDPTRSFLSSRTIFNSYISRRRRSLIGADDGNWAQSSLRASPGFGVFQNSSRCARRRNDLSSTLISSPAVPSPFSNRSATQTSCNAFDKAIPNNQPTLIRHYSMLKTKVSPPPTLLATFWKLVPFLCTGRLTLIFTTLHVLLVEDDSTNGETLDEQES